MDVDRKRRCPHCHRRFDGTDPLIPGRKPKPGDWTICGGCGGLAVYYPRRRGGAGPWVLDLRAPTTFEQVRADADQRVAAARTALAAAPNSRAALPVWRELTVEPGEEPVPRGQ